MKHVDRGTRVKTLKDVQDRVVIIGAEPGMGKSTLLTHLAANTKHLHPSLWILNINLLENVDQFNEWKENQTNIDLKEVIKFLYSSIDIKYEGNDNIRDTVAERVNVNETDQLSLSDDEDKHMSLADLSEIRLFNHYYNNGRLSVLIDGFDEICPHYSNEVIRLLCVLKSSNVSHLWITSRPYDVLHNLEVALGTFAFNLIPLTKLEQIEYLHRVWSQRFAVTDLYLNICYRCVEGIHYNIKYILNDNEGKFMSLPLHLHMIAEMYQDYFEIVFNYNCKRPITHFKELDDISNLTSLYERFMNTKFDKIRFGEKKHRIDLKDPDMRRIVEKERTCFIENHKKLAAYTLLDRGVFLSECDIKEVQEFIVSVKLGEEKTGVVECIIGNKPEFVHYTFAEYFAVEYMFSKLKSDNYATSAWEQFMRVISINENYGFRRFINGKLQRDGDIIVNDLKTDERHLDTMFNVLHNNNMYATLTIPVMMHAIEEDFEYIIIFLLQCAALNRANKTNIIQFISRTIGDNLCLFCLAVKFYRRNIVKCLIKLVADIDRDRIKDLFYCDCRFSPLIFAVETPVMSNFTLGSLQHDPNLIVQLFTLRHERVPEVTLAHYLGKKVQYIEFCYEQLSKLSLEHRLRIFNIKDSAGQLPLHYAANQNGYGFFFSLEKLLGREEFIKMCRTTDNDGFTPICRLPYNEQYFDKLKILLEKVYEDLYVDLQDFVFNKMSNLYPKSLKTLENVNWGKYVGNMYFRDAAWAKHIENARKTHTILAKV
ncbi:uncharacterized protein LOC142979197 [Anticarsia gemmatalis]|uniref:uncharacterized protein LOC142979197 n=1 Tax=Anticarsia gemmatalis TaxID=129554 RepID=UPI003F75B653